ncbi:5-oxoprolinase [Thermogymnomonas acidicola]|uniref:5-oxoprolinase n=1 Tax=Thermogymnomonas acidicola TaxID=399579 RepID=A0AA37BTQ3_9ARCH|nr:hydantoinase B/oxoprolinase family protein [Thermogymnomonas acidicola]GGM77551.1 5-oxoprolinase [Thermogymnomonas acidicola]
MTELRTAGTNVDPFTREIIANGLRAAAEEMFYAFGKAARSPVIYETLDYASAITTPEGELVAQANGVPGFLGVLDYATRDLVSSRGVEKGDIFMANVPYRGGTHLNDVTLIMPVFHEDEALFMLVNKGHWSEVGGMRMGSWSPDATEIYQEGTQFPNVRIGRDDRIDEEIVRIIEANSRTPEMTLGDMEAQVASMRVARNRILRLIDRYGSEAVRASVESSILAGEMKARELLRALPHGSFEIEDFIDDDGINEEPIRVRARLTVTDDEFLVDFTGSSRSVRGSINSPYPATVSSVRTVFVAASDPHTEPNGGFFRPVKVVAPEGSIFNPVRPAPTSTYWESMSYAGDLVWHILAELIPDKLSAGHFLTVGATIVGGVDDRPGRGKPFAIVEPQPGGWGASFDRDGESALVCSGDGETYLASAEVIERTLPIRVERLELNTRDGPSFGKYRGGFGIVKDYRILCSEASFSASFGRSRFTAWGAGGGGRGTPNYFVVSGSVNMRGRRIGGLTLRRGDVVSIRTGSGGAWGPAQERPRPLIERDLQWGYIDAETAEKWGSH